MSMQKYSIDDLFSLFEESLSASDILSAKVNSQISTCITKERLKLHMNQAEFAKHIKASQSLVSRWESGDYNFSVKKIAEIASSLNLDINFSLYDISFQREGNTVEYNDSAKFTRTICYSSKPSSYNSKNYASPCSGLSSITNKEENKYASVC